MVISAARRLRSYYCMPLACLLALTACEQYRRTTLSFRSEDKNAERQVACANACLFRYGPDNDGFRHCIGTCSGAVTSDGPCHRSQLPPHGVCAQTCSSANLKLGLVLGTLVTVGYMGFMVLACCPG